MNEEYERLRRELVESTIALRDCGLNRQGKVDMKKIEEENEIMLKRSYHAEERALSYILDHNNQISVEESNLLLRLTSIGERIADLRVRRSFRFDLDKERKRDKFYRHIPLIAGAVMGMVMIGTLYFGPYSETRHQNLYKQSQAVVDTNHDKVVSESEWKDAYQKLGVLYDERTFDPKKDLTNKDLVKLLGR